jgi:hypothetical protein
VTRQCAGCGLLEERTAKGVNLDPILSLCVDCLIAYAKDLYRPVPDESCRWFDARQAAAGKDE